MYGALLSTELTNSTLLTPLSTVIEKLIVPQLVKNARTLCSPYFHYRTHNSLLFVSILDEMNQVQVIPSYFLNIQFNTILPSTSRSSKWPLSFRFPNHKNLWIFSFSPLCAT